VFVTTFIDLFAGIGGFHLALRKLGCKCVYASEWDPYSRKTYEANFSSLDPELFTSERFVGDICNKQNQALIPNKFDILCAGFPCQPFSNAGKQLGFKDVRGGLFFEIATITKKHKPNALFLENVRNLLIHNSGKTFSVIREIIEKELGYTFFYKIMCACDYGLPTYRPRLIMVALKRNSEFRWPQKVPFRISLNEIFSGKCERKTGYTLRVGGANSPINGRHNWDGYIVKGKEHRISVLEAKRMMGFPDDFVFPVSDKIAMKQLGNSVAVDVIEHVGASILEAL
jgi:DNA (cytosine-5)-methyltransferase 1